MGVRILPQHLTIMGALALALSLVALLSAADPTQALEEGKYRDDQVIVKLAPRTSIDSVLAGRPLKPLDKDLANENVYLLEVTDGTPVETLVAQLVRLRGVVLYAEPNFLATAPEDPADPTYGDGRMRARSPSYRMKSSDANTTFATNLNLSCVSETNRGKGSTVAVLDTGAQLSHPRLEANFKGITRYDYDFVDNDEKPIDGRIGFDSPYDDNDVKDELAGHGTHVAGIVDKVVPGSKLMALRVLDSEGYGDAYTVAKAIVYARDLEVPEVDVINLSLGTSEYSKLLDEIVEKVMGDNIVVVAAAGNSGAEEPHYPAAGKHGTLDLNGSLFADPTKDGLLAVTSVDRNEIKSDFATFDEWVDIAAPGEDIRSTFLRDKYATWSGTSMATPFVSGQAALIQAVNGPLTSAEIEQEIRSGASVDSDEFYANNPEYDSTLVPPVKGRRLGEGHADVCGSL
jgi:subtilisin family serine protease